MFSSGLNLIGNGRPHTTSNNLSIFLYPDLVHSVMRPTFGLDGTGEARILLSNIHAVLLFTSTY